MRRAFFASLAAPFVTPKAAAVKRSLIRPKLTYNRTAAFIQETAAEVRMRGYSDETLRFLLKATRHLESKK